MIKEIIEVGRNVEDAISQGCIKLGLSRDDVQVEVLEMPKKGFLGIGNTPAKVRVYMEVNKAQLAVSYIRDMLTNMGIIDFTSTVTEDENSINIVLQGDNLGCIIGRRGETLDAMQYLTSLTVNRSDNKYTRVTIDSGNYREKREKTLESLARKLAITATKTGRSSTLEPMNPYERRIIHATVSQIEGAVSKSIGEEPNRRVVISSTNPRKPRPLVTNDNRRGSYNNKDSKPYNNDAKPFNNEQRAPYNKDRGSYNNNFKSNSPIVETTQRAVAPQEAADKPLYSKIDLD